MEDPISQEVINEFYAIAEKGDEAKLKNFFIENIKRFPQKAQDAIITAFFEDALAKKVARDEATSNFQEEGLKILGALDTMEKELKKREELDRIKNG